MGLINRSVSWYGRFPTELLHLIRMFPRNDSAYIFFTFNYLLLWQILVTREYTNWQITVFNLAGLSFSVSKQYCLAVLCLLLHLWGSCLQRFTHGCAWLRHLTHPSFFSSVGAFAGPKCFGVTSLKAQEPISLVQMHKFIKLSCKSPCFIYTIMRLSTESGLSTAHACFPFF